MTESSGIKLSVNLPHSRCLVSRDAVIRVAEAADEAGLWGVVVEDHVLIERGQVVCPEGGGDPRSILESLQTLAFVAARTERVRLVTDVLVLPYRHPVLLAKEIATLDVLSQGRVVLGIGVGALRGRQAADGVVLSANARVAAREFDAFGVHGDRGPLTDEYLAAMKAMWTQDPAVFHGSHVTFDDLDMYPRPVQQPHPPIWVGGRSDKALGRAARYADGWCPSQTSVERLTEGRRRIQAQASELGRTVSSFGVSNPACIRPTDEEAQAMTRRQIGHFFTDDDALWSQTITGSPETFLAHVRRFRDAGGTHLNLKLVRPSVDMVVDQIRLLASEVLPALAEDEARRAVV